MKFYAIFRRHEVRGLETHYSFVVRELGRRRGESAWCVTNLPIFQSVQAALNHLFIQGITRVAFLGDCQTGVAVPFKVEHLEHFKRCIEEEGD